jgi:hypothetical protein
MSIAILATTLAACAGSGAPTWTFSPVPPSTMKPEPVAATCPPGSTPDEPGPVEQTRPIPPETAAFDRRAGRLVALANAGHGVETWTFDVCTNAWAQMHPNRQPPVGYRLVYDIDSDRTIEVAAGNVWAYDLGADAWTEKGVAPAYATLW